jgi:hypothetical protein
VEWVVSHGVSEQMIGDQERLLSTSDMTRARGQGIGAKMEGEGGCARYIVYRALSRINTNTPVKCKGRRDHRTRTGTTPKGAAGETIKKKQEKKSTNEGRRRGD